MKEKPTIIGLIKEKIGIDKLKDDLKKELDFKRKEYNYYLNEKYKLEKTDLENLFIKAKPFTSFFNLNYWEKRKQKRIEKKKIDTVVLVRMELNNGYFREWLVDSKNGFFYFRKKMYVFDISLKYFIIERGIWVYDFHEEISIPLRKKISFSEHVDILFKKIEDESRKSINSKTNINEIKTIIENTSLVDVENSLNPLTLKRFMDTEVIRQLLQGAVLGKIFKIMFILTIIIACLMLINLLINMYASGIFGKIGNFLHFK